MANCLQCGAKLKTSTRKPPKFCRIECRNKYYYEKKKGEKNLFCIACGKELSGRRNKYCSEECKRKTLNAQMYAQRKEEFEEFKEYKKPSPKKRTKPKVSIEEVARLSKEAGMSAGQYVAKYGL